MSEPVPSLQTPSCLIVVDMQVQFLNEHTRHLVDGIQPLLEHFDWVFASRLLPLPGGSIHRWKGYLPKPAGDPGSMLALDFSERSIERTVVVEKTGFGALTPTARGKLSALGVTEAFVCGVDADLCVMRTVGDLLELNIRPRLLTDLIGSTAGEPLLSGAQLILKRMIGHDQLTTSDQFMQQTVSI